MLLATTSSVDQQNFDKLKDAYSACMDENAIKKAGVKPLHEILKQIADMFPLNKTTRTLKSPLGSPNLDGMKDIIEYLQKLGVSALISVSVGADDKDPDTVVVQASPPYSIGLPVKDYYKDEAIIEKYENTLTVILENIFTDRGPAESLSHKVVEFEKKLAAASPDPEDRDDVTVSIGTGQHSVLAHLANHPISNTTTQCL